jgi:hypothetical protein
MVFLEVWREMRVEGMMGKERREEGNGYHFSLFKCFKN